MTICSPGSRNKEFNTVFKLDRIARSVVHYKKNYDLNHDTLDNTDFVENITGRIKRDTISSSMAYFM